MPAEIVPLRDTSQADVPAMLRRLADAVESGDEPAKAMIGIRVDHHGEIDIYGWGQTDGLQTLATLHLAAHKMARAVTS